MDLKGSWEQIRAWVAANMPEHEFVTPPGATDAQIAAAEAALGFPLPDDVRASYRLHDGTREISLPRASDMIPIGQLPGHYTFQRTTFEYYVENGGAEAEEVEGPIKPVRWSPRRVPITENGGGDGLQIDLDPAAGGTVGQIIWADHEVGPRRVVAPSWAAYLAQIAADCEAGVYYYDEEAEEPWSRRDEEQADDPGDRPDPFEGIDDSWLNEMPEWPDEPPHPKPG